MEDISKNQAPAARGEKRSLGWAGAIAVTVAGGIVGIIVISIIGLILRILLGIGLVGFFSPFYEEPLKAIGLIALAMFFPGAFKSKKAGAVLGTIAGVLFGLFEIWDFSILYGLMVGAGTLAASVANTLLLARIFTSLPMHAIASMIFGLGVAYAAMSSIRPGLRHIFSGNALALMDLSIGFHIVYNLANLIPSLLLRSELIGVILAFLVMLAGLYMAYRLYKYIPRLLDQMPRMGAKDLLMSAMGWGPRKGAPVAEKGP